MMNEGIVKEFRDFLMRGNIIELAVAFIMAAAFVPVVTSLVNGVILPFIAAIFGEPNFDNIGFDVGDARVVIDGIAGCRIVPPDPATIAEALRGALAAPRRVQSRERMRVYSLETVAAALLTLYGRVIETHRRGRRGCRLAPSVRMVVQSFG